MLENRQGDVSRVLLASHLPYHSRCLREDATNPDLTVLNRLTLVRGRIARMREIEREMEEQQGRNHVAQIEWGRTGSLSFLAGSTGPSR